MEGKVLKEKLDAEDTAEYEEMIREMAAKMNDTETARKGQRFHRKVSGKYGRQTAEEMTQEMMNRVLEVRLEALLRRYHILGEKKEEGRNGWKRQQDAAKTADMLPITAVRTKDMSA